MGFFTNVGKNEMLDASSINQVALFNGDPSGAGVEISGGSPAYARQATVMTAASGGQVVITADATFDVPSGATINYVGYFNSAAPGVLLAYDDVTQEVYGSQGQYIVDSSTFSI